jgi:hypothetical protein
MHPAKLAAGLDDLLTRAGWTHEEFLEALCQDVVQRGHRMARSH